MKLVRTIILILTFSLLSFVSVFGGEFNPEELYDSVFLVYTENGFGSGFAIGPNLIITNAHVVEGGDNIRIREYSGEEYNAYVYNASGNSDLALLVADNSELYVAMPLGEDMDYHAGDDVFAIGTPKDLALAWTLTKGVISARERVIEGQRYIQIDAAINSGNSGGPLLNSNGQVIGINTLKLDNSEGIGFALSVGEIRQYLLSIGVTEIEGELLTVPYEFKEEAINDPTKKDSQEERIIYRENKTGIVVLSALLILSVVINIVLAVSIKQKKKEEISRRAERTDFEIEIEEKRN